jgi:hypothetical protein
VDCVERGGVAEHVAVVPGLLVIPQTAEIPHLIDLLFLIEDETGGGPLILFPWRLPPQHGMIEGPFGLVELPRHVFLLIDVLEVNEELRAGG